MFAVERVGCGGEFAFGGFQLNTGHDSLKVKHPWAPFYSCIFIRNCNLCRLKLTHGRGRIIYYWSGRTAQLIVYLMATEKAHLA